MKNNLLTIIILLIGLVLFGIWMYFSGAAQTPATRATVSGEAETEVVAVCTQGLNLFRALSPTQALGAGVVVYAEGRDMAAEAGMKLAPMEEGTAAEDGESETRESASEEFDEAEGAADDVFDLVDEVAAQLLAEAAPGPGGPTALPDGPARRP